MNAAATGASRLFATMAHYERLEVERRNPRGRLFISDYNGGHPFVKQYPGELATSSLLELGDVTRYAGIDEDLHLRTRLADLHRDYDAVGYRPEHVVPSGGSSALIATFCTWLMLAGATEVHYLPRSTTSSGFSFSASASCRCPSATRTPSSPSSTCGCPSGGRCSS